MALKLSTNTSGITLRIPEKIVEDAADVKHQNKV